MFFVIIYTKNTYPTDAKTGVGEVATKTRLSLLTASFVARSHREPVFE